jgi:hypothetical protein
MELLIMQFSPFPVTSFLWGPNIPLGNLFWNTLSVPPLMRQGKFHMHTEQEAKL